LQKYCTKAWVIGLLWNGMERGTYCISGPCI